MFAAVHADHRATDQDTDPALGVGTVAESLPVAQHRLNIVVSRQQRRGLAESRSFED
jgi:hypothetical protein